MPAESPSVEAAIGTMLDAHDRTQRRLAILDLVVFMPVCFALWIVSLIVLSWPWWFLMLLYLILVGIMHVVVVTLARRRLVRTTEQLLAQYPPGSDGFGAALNLLEQRTDLALRGPFIWRLECAAREAAEEAEAEQDEDT